MPAGRPDQGPGARKRTVTPDRSSSCKVNSGWPNGWIVPPCDGLRTPRSRSPRPDDPRPGAAALCRRIRAEFAPLMRGHPGTGTVVSTMSSTRRSAAAEIGPGRSKMRTSCCDDGASRRKPPPAARSVPREVRGSRVRRGSGPLASPMVGSELGTSGSCAASDPGLRASTAQHEGEPKHASFHGRIALRDRPRAHRDGSSNQVRSAGSEPHNGVQATSRLVIVSSSCTGRIRQFSSGRTGARKARAEGWGDGWAARIGPAIVASAKAAATRAPACGGYIGARPRSVATAQAHPRSHGPVHGHRGMGCLHLDATRRRSGT